MSAPRLEWVGGAMARPFWRAEVNGMPLRVVEMWRGKYEAFIGAVSRVVDGPFDTLGAAQLACERECMAWLSEGVAAFGGRVLDAGEVALCAQALGEAGHARQHRGPLQVAHGQKMLALARKLETP